MIDQINGRVAWIFGDDFDVDFIIGIENIRVNDKEKILQILMKHFEEDFTKKVRAGDILVGSKNFGYGHPHPQAMMGMRELGIITVIAESFAFAFYRSELASGMRLFECPEISKKVERWDEISVAPDKSVLINKTRNITLKLAEVPEVPLKIMESEGIIGYLKRNMK